MFARAYEEEDKEKVIDLYEKIYDGRFTNEFWDWRFNKFGKPIRYLMWHDDELIGHYVLTQIPMQFDNKISYQLQSMSVLTHPSYQNKGIIFPTLAKLAYDEALKQNYKIIMGFPNERAKRFCFEYLGWKKFSNIVELEFIIKSEQINFLSDKLEVQKILDFKNVDKLWNNYKQNIGCCIVRNSSFLNWRFFEHPEVSYTKKDPFLYFSFVIKKNSEPIFYFVLKKYGNVCHVIDYFGKINNETINAMLTYSIDFCKQNNFCSLTFWSNQYSEKSPIYEISKKLGFVAKPPSAYFGVLSLDQNLTSMTTNQENWLVTMSDSDVF